MVSNSLMRVGSRRSSIPHGTTVWFPSIYQGTCNPILSHPSFSCFSLLPSASSELVISTRFRKESQKSELEQLLDHQTLTRHEADQALSMLRHSSTVRSYYDTVRAIALDTMLLSCTAQHSPALRLNLTYTVSRTD